MNVLRTELEKYINQLEIEMGKTTAAESELLRTCDLGADVLKSRVLTLREIIGKLKSILNSENKTYEDGIKEMEEKIVEKSKTGRPIAIDDRLYFIKDDIDHLREIMDKM